MTVIAQPGSLCSDYIHDCNAASQHLNSNYTVSKKHLSILTWTLENSVLLLALAVRCHRAGNRQSHLKLLRLHVSLELHPVTNESVTKIWCLKFLSHDKGGLANDQKTAQETLVFHVKIIKLATWSFFCRMITNLGPESNIKMEKKFSTPRTSAIHFKITFGFVKNLDLSKT